MIGVTKNSNKLSLTFTMEVCVNTNNLVTEVALLSNKVLLKRINMCNRVAPVTIGCLAIRKTIRIAGLMGE